MTDRGVPVARLVAIDPEGVLDRLEREGALTRARSARRPVANQSLPLIHRLSMGLGGRVSAEKVS